MKTARNNHIVEETVNITLDDAWLEGILRIPSRPRGLIIFAHGSGSSRFSHRNQFVADYLYAHKYGTLLFDLLTEEEEKEDYTLGTYRFDIPLLAQRLEKVTEWLLKKLKPERKSIPLGYFGSSTGAAAAIEAAVNKPDVIKAIVSRGGRPDMAASVLPQLKAPILLIVGSRDPNVLTLNREAYHYMTAHRRLSIVEGATHLFEEPGMLENVAQLATEWFKENL